MPERIHFHLDENVSIQIARALRQYGCDVTTPADANLLAASDAAHLAYARITRRAMVTHDADLLRLANGGTLPAGIAYCAPRTRITSEIVRGLLLIYDVLTPEELTDHIEFL